MPNQTSDMKYLQSCFLGVVVAFSFYSYSVLAGARAGDQTQLGPHSAQKFALAKHVGGLREAAGSSLYSANTVAIVLTVEQKMNGNKQEITASAAAHKDGPTGALVGVDGLTVHVTQPANFGTQPQSNMAEAHITNTVPAPGGKYRTVVAEARLNSPKYDNCVVSLTIPGDK